MTNDRFSHLPIQALFEPRQLSAIDFYDNFKLYFTQKRVCFHFYVNLEKTKTKQPNKQQTNENKTKLNKN